MRVHSHLSIACFLLLGVAVQRSSAQASLNNREKVETVSIIHSILRDASDLALKQEEREGFWTQTVLLQIGGLQIRAGDFDGALRSLRGSSYEYGRHSGLMHLVEALARAGEKERALEVSRLLDGMWGRAQQTLPDVIEFEWVVHLIAKGDLVHASKAIDQIKSPRERHQALRALAVACAKSGDTEQSATYFKRAIEAAAGIKTDYDRAESMWQTARAMRISGMMHQAQATLHRLANGADNLKDPWARVSALRECAVLAANLKDNQTARDLFDRAIKCHQAVDELNKPGALEQIAIAQANVGFIDSARKTASMIEHSNRDFARDADRERALYGIALAQLGAGDDGGALATALSVKYFVQYRDDVLNALIAYYLRKPDLKAALTISRHFENPSRKAAAVLKVAAAHAKAGDRNKASEIAARIKLTHRSETLKSLLTGHEEGFDYRRPESWGENYDAHDSFTMASHRLSVQRTAEVAAAAMELAQSLPLQPSQSFAALFNDINMEEVIQSLARTHATFGDPNDVLGPVDSPAIKLECLGSV
jgi:tetratricopeptide (TPR) repeat protein